MPGTDCWRLLNLLPKIKQERSFYKGERDGTEGFKERFRELKGNGVKENQRSKQALTVIQWQRL